MITIKFILMLSLIVYLPVSQAWENVDDSELYEPVDEYVEEPVEYANQGITPEMIYQLALQRQMQAAQYQIKEQILDNARHQQNLQNIRERGEQWAKSFKNPYMD